MNLFLHKLDIRSIKFPIIKEYAGDFNAYMCHRRVRCSLMQVGRVSCRSYIVKYLVELDFLAKI